MQDKCVGSPAKDHITSAEGEPGLWGVTLMSVGERRAKKLNIIQRMKKSSKGKTIYTYLGF